MATKTAKTTTKASSGVASNDVTPDAMSEVVEKENEQKEVTKKEKKIVEPLKENEEIEVISLIPNVYYTDKKTGDSYVWENVGDGEYMTVESIKNMHRNFKTYFLDLWLKPMDERVISTLKLERTYASLEKLMTKDAYTPELVSSSMEEVKKLKIGTKMSVINRIKVLITGGEIVQPKVIRTIENTLGLDLFSLID